MHSQILVYRNQSGVTEMMEPLFVGEPYEWEVAENKQDIFDRLDSGEVEMLITDIELFEEDGFSLIRELREYSPVPIMVLSEKEDEFSKVRAFQSGADDYVVYPCSPLELMARVKAHIRRCSQLSTGSAKTGRIYRIQDLVVNDVTRSVTVADKEVRLTPIEYKILKLLVKEKGKVFSTPEIYESIWNMKAIGADNTIAVHIRHIREKIETNPKRPIYLKVVWGTGYKVG